MRLATPIMYEPQDTGGIIARAPISARDWRLMHGAAALAAHGPRVIVPWTMTPELPDIDYASFGIKVVESGRRQRWHARTYGGGVVTPEAIVEVDGVDITPIGGVELEAVASPAWGEVALSTRTLRVERGNKAIPARVMIMAEEISDEPSAALIASAAATRGGLPLRGEVARELSAHAAVDTWGLRTFCVAIGDAGAEGAVCALRQPTSGLVAAVAVVASGSGTWRLVSATSGPGATVSTDDVATCAHTAGELDSPIDQQIDVEIVSGSVTFESVTMTEYFEGIED